MLSGAITSPSALIDTIPEVNSNRLDDEITPKEYEEPVEGPITFMLIYRHPVYYIWPSLELVDSSVKISSLK